MKNKFIASLPGFFLAFLCTTATGQVSMDKMRLLKNISSQTECVWENGLGPGAPNKPGQNVLRNFEQKFTNVTSVRWYESSYGFVVKFNLEGIDYRVDFDKKGNWLYTIRNYDEMKLPEDVMRLINDSYNEYSITLVQEIETPFIPLTFVVHLDGKKDMIQLLVSGDETQEWQRFRKPHSGSFTSSNRN
jgi:hypothetical protein